MKWIGSRYLLSVVDIKQESTEKVATFNQNKGLFTRSV